MKIRRDLRGSTLRSVVGPLVSVIMPLHNRENLLAESVRSVKEQTVTDWELIIVDDASSDASLALAHQLALEDSRIRVISLAENSGVANVRNIAISAALGKYLAFLDSDDLWLPLKLEIQLGFMQDSGVGFTFTQYRRFGSDGFLGPVVKVPSAVDYAGLLKGNVIGCLTAMIDRTKIGPFSMPSVRHEDYATWLYILKRGHVAVGIQEDLARYRISSESVSANKRRSALWTWQIYRRTEKLSLHYAIWCFVNYVVKAACSRQGI